MADRLIDKLRQLLASAEGRNVDLKNLRHELGLQPYTPEWDSIRVSMLRLSDQNVCKPSGNNDGVYKVLVPVKPVYFTLNGDDKEGILEVRHPRSYIDDTTFGLDDIVELSESDLILITGETNFGKTALALSYLGENLNLFQRSVLMGCEYTSSEGEISPKLKRRLRRMDWVTWTKDGEPRFELLPTEQDYQYWVAKNALTVIDWITLPGEFWMIDSVMKTIKNSIGRGFGIVVLQMKKGNEFAEGGQRSERVADLVLKVDRFSQYESILTIGKVKAAVDRSPVGRKFAFEIADYGANLQNIREVVRCLKCWGTGKVKVEGQFQRCPSCKGKKYIDKLGGE